MPYRQSNSFKGRKLKEENFLKNQKPRSQKKMTRPPKWIYQPILIADGPEINILYYSFSTPRTEARLGSLLQPAPADYALLQRKASFP